MSDIEGAERAFQRFTGYLGSRRQRLRLLLQILATLLAALGLAAVFVSGPYLQLAVVFLVGGDSSSLVTSLSSDGIDRFPTLAEYAEAAVWPPYLISGLFCATAMSIAKTKRAFLFNACLSVAIAWTVIDASSGISAQDLVVSVVCNILGGLLLALFSYVTVVNFNVIRSLGEHHKIVERAIWVIWPFLSYLALAFCLFFALSFVINTPDSSFSARLEPPINGYYASNVQDDCYSMGVKEFHVAGDSEGSVPDACMGAAKKSAPMDEKEYFGAMEKIQPEEGNTVEWTGMGKGLSLFWRNDSKARALVSLRLLENCLTPDEIAKELSSKTIGEFKASSVEIKVDDALSHFSVVSPEKLRGVEVSEDSAINQFWIIPSRDDATKLEVQRFVMDGKLSTKEGMEQVHYRIDLLPFKHEGDELAVRSRTLWVRRDGAGEPRPIELSISQERPVTSQNGLCRSLGVLGEEDVEKAEAIGPLINIVFSVSPARTPLLDDLNDTSYMMVTGLNGWIATDGWPKSSLDSFITYGEVKYLSLFGAVMDVQIGGRNVNTGATSTLQAAGSFRGRTDGSAILISGDARWLSLNEHRLTQTRWEQLDAGVRIPIILGLPTAAYFMLRLVLSTLRRPRRRVWHLP